MGDSRPPPPASLYRAPALHQRREGRPALTRHGFQSNKKTANTAPANYTLDELVPLKGRISAVIAIQIRHTPLLPGCIAGPLT